MTVVIDASVTVAWSLKDEARADLDELLLRVQAEGAFAPPIWRYEVANVLVGAARRNRIPLNVLDGELRALAALPVEIDRSAGSGEGFEAVVELALRSRLTVYDASYLELALRRGVPLATLDGELRQAARRENVTLIPGSNP